MTDSTPTPQPLDLDCPFCGWIEKQSGAYIDHPTGPCVLSGFTIRKSVWNNRSLPPPPPVEAPAGAAKVVLDLCQALEKHLDKRSYAEKGEDHTAWMAGCKFLASVAAPAPAAPLGTDIETIDRAAERFPRHDWAQAWGRIKPILAGAPLGAGEALDRALDEFHDACMELGSDSVYGAPLENAEEKVKWKREVVNQAVAALSSVPVADKPDADLTLSQAVAAVDAEPEFPGEPPPEMVEALRNCDQDVAVHALRLAVRMTKDGIRDRLRAAIPVDPAPQGPDLFCAHCGKNPATCVGRSEGHGGFTPACDECCGHGNEDGSCTAPTDLAGILREASEVIFGLEEEVADLRQAAPSPGAGA